MEKPATTNMRSTSSNGMIHSLRKVALPLTLLLIWAAALSGQLTSTEEVPPERVTQHQIATSTPAPHTSSTWSIKRPSTTTNAATPQLENYGNSMSSLMHVSGALGSPKPCNDKLYTPTFVTYVDAISASVIVDCWHHRVILQRGSNNDPLGALDTPITQWSSLANVTFVSTSAALPRAADTARKSLATLNIPHSIATNGEIFVTESSVGGSNGDNHSLLVFRMVAQQDSQQQPRLEFLEEVLGCDGNRARRPHRVIYDPHTLSFFLYMTSPAFLSRFVWNAEKQTLERVACQSLPFMKGMYARSIVAVNGSLYFTAGPGVIWRTELNPTTGLVVNKQSYSIKYLGFVKGKMNDLAYLDGWWYATSTVPCAMVRFRDINKLWEHHKIHTQLELCKPFSRRDKRCLGGTPYFVSKVGDRIVVPYIFGCSGVVSFRVSANADASIIDVKQHWGGGWVEDSEDLTCRGTEW